MATYQITGVRTERPPRYEHEHITDVQLNHSSTFVLRRETVINDLRAPSGDRYYTEARGVRAKVIVAGCPVCAKGDYITTEPDWTTENNLLSLPRF